MSDKQTIKHIFKEGSRDHVVSYDSLGQHCSVENCEINEYRKSLKLKQTIKERIEVTLKEFLKVCCECSGQQCDSGITSLSYCSKFKDMLDKAYYDRFIEMIDEEINYNKNIFVGLDSCGALRKLKSKLMESK